MVIVRASPPRCGPQEKHGVDTSGYGSGLAKTVQDLLEEVRAAGGSTQPRGMNHQRMRDLTAPPCAPCRALPTAQQSRAESVLSVENGVAQRTVRVLSLHILNDQGEVRRRARLAASTPVCSQAHSLLDLLTSRFLARPPAGAV